MRAIQRVHDNRPQSTNTELDIACRQVKWDELVAILDQLEQKFGWKQYEGSAAYTRDVDQSHKSNVLGGCLNLSPALCTINNQS